LPWRDRQLKPDGRGRLIPKLYSKPEANKELRNMLNLGTRETPKDVTQLSDAELIETLAAQAKELGIEIDLSYNFSPETETEETDGAAPIVEADAVDVTPDAPNVAPASSGVTQPEIAGARPVRAARKPQR
jgi:hypothetical protein